MKKRILCLMTAALLVLGAPMTAFAAETPDPNAPTDPTPAATTPITKEWTVRYDGDKMNTEVGGVKQKIDLTMPTQLPGGKFNMKAEIHNDSSNKTDWYLSNEILESLETTVKTQANGGAYIYVLTYHGPAENGVEPAAVEIYNSSSVGGTKASKSGAVGLKEIEDLEDHFYLDRLLPGEKAAVKLYVELDGPTVTNSYQDSMAELKLNFAVEKIREGTVIRRVTTTRYLSNVIKTGSVQTGDSAPLVIYSALALASGLALIVVATKQIRKNRNEKGELQ